MARIKWNDELIRAMLLSLAVGDKMPTASELRSAGRNDLACVIVRRGGFDAWARMSGLQLSQHDSRRGWHWEHWFEEQCKSRGLTVTIPDGVKSRDDLVVNQIGVDVKSAAGRVYEGVWQWTWSTNGSRSSVYALVALLAGKPPMLLIAPGCEISASTVTARGSPGGITGKWAQWRNRWDLLGGTR